MIELEVLVEVFDSYSKMIKILSDFNFLKEEHIMDTYFYDPLRENLKPNKNGKTSECLRIRNTNDSTKITYKKDVYEKSIWQYSNENELTVENPIQMKEILINLGFKELLTINNLRRYYVYQDYEIVLEIVENLGIFMEIELKSKVQENHIKEKRDEINHFIRSLNINVSPELNAGKPELYIIKHSISV